MAYPFFVMQLVEIGAEGHPRSGSLAQLVICLDTNYLSRSLVQGCYKVDQILASVDQDQLLTTAAICWYEFLGGPISPKQTKGVQSLLHQARLSHLGVDRRFFIFAV